MARFHHHQELASPQIATHGHSPIFSSPPTNGHHFSSFSSSSPSASSSRDHAPGASSAAGPSSSRDDDLMLTLLATQATVDVDARGYAILGFDEVEAVKSELDHLSERLVQLSARSQREAKILTAARTLDKLHQGHKRMSKQTTEEMAQAERRAQAANKDKALAVEREALLRRTLNEHYASALAWESRRLQHLASHLPDANSSTPTNRSSSPKGKERETSHTLEFERLQNRVAELEDLIDDGGTREADLAGEVKRLTKELERERVQAEKDRSHLEAQIHEVRNTTTGRPELRSTDNDDTIRAILLPLLAFATKPPPPDDVPIDSLAQLVREEYEILEGLLSVGKEELTSVKERLEGEASALRKGTDVLREETQRLTKENQSLREETQKLRETPKPTPTPSESTILSELELLWLILPSKSASSLLAPAGRRNVSSSSHHSHSGSSQPSSASPSSTRHPVPPSPAVDMDFSALSAAYGDKNGAGGGGGGGEPYPGLQGFSDRVRALVDDGRVLLERTAKAVRERDIYKSNSERAQRLVQDSRAGLETYQRQVKALEERLETEGGKGGDNSLEQFNELESTIAALREEKGRLEYSLNAQIEACDSLSEANESLSQRALALSDEAAKEKRSLQTRFEAETSKLRGELKSVRDELEHLRTREDSQGMALLDELNSLQDEVQMLRAQLRSGTPKQ